MILYQSEFNAASVGKVAMEIRDLIGDLVETNGL